MATWLPAAFGALLLSGLLLGGCGAGPTAPGGPSDGLHDDAPSTSGEDLLADTHGDAPFFLGEASVRVAESHPVQLFLEATGNAPTPCHRIAYTVSTEQPDKGNAEIRVVLTTVATEGACAQVLQPHRVIIPLGTADLPVTVRVGDDEFVTTIHP